MSIYARFKRAPEGFRALVQLLETTPVSRRQKMIDAGMAEDPLFTERALQYMMTFQDVLELPDMELAELIALAPVRTVAFAIRASDKELQARFIKNSKPQVAAEIRDLVQMQGTLGETGGAQLKLIEIARKLERDGMIKTKKIPG